MARLPEEISLNIALVSISTIETIKAILESGNSVELSATGFSMFPTFRPGYRIVVNPLVKKVIPLKGSIVVICRENNTLLLHRLIDVRSTINNNREFITRGDCSIEPDVPLQLNQIIGVATSAKFKEKEYLIKPEIPGDLWYKYNRFLLWFYILPSRIKIRYKIG